MSLIAISRKKKTRGFTLLEALFAAVLLALLAAGISTLYTSGLQTLDTVLIAQPDDPLSRPEVVQYAVCEQGFDQFGATRTNVSGLFEAPLWVAHLIGECLGREMIVHGGSVSGSGKPEVTGNELVVMEDLHRVMGCPEPEGLANEPKGG